jgi:putative spermidine/putrescine transport system substrate-binding protein
MIKGDIRILGYAYGNVAPWRAEGAPIDYAVPKEGQTAFPLYFQILKGGTPAQVYHSEQLINRLLDPTVLGRYCQLVLTAPTNPKVALPDVLKSDPAFQSGNVANAIQLDWNIVAQQTAAWQEQFNREIKANLK